MFYRVSKRTHCFNKYYEAQFKIMKHKYKLNLSDHGTKIGGAQEVLGQNSQAYDMNLGLSCAEPRVGF